MARRSTRLSNRNSSTPKRVSLSHDAIMTPRTLPAKLAVLHESNEMSDASQDNALHSERTSEARLLITQTPSKTTPIKPSSQEMHPQHHQQSTAKPLDEARHLGFSHMGAYTAPPKQTSKIAMLQCTPTKSSGIEHKKRSPSFQFTFRREHSLELSPQAKRLMNEKREEAAKIRQQMIANDQELETVDTMVQRKIAVPKSQKSRFGQAHQAEFDKMGSIAGHASSFRADPSRATSRTCTPITKSKRFHISPGPKSLKRSPSKAGLDETDSSPTRPTPRFAKNTIASSSTPRPHSSSRRRGFDADSLEESSTAKRVRTAESGDVSTAKQMTMTRGHEPATTPVAQRVNEGSLPTVSKKYLTTPTQVSPSRTPNVRSFQTSRIPGPASAVTKHASCVRSRESEQSTEPLSPLLSRSPTKMTMITKTNDMNTQAPPNTSALLSHAPLKLGTAWKPDAPKLDNAKLKPKSTPFLSQPPIKPVSPRKAAVECDGDQKPSASSVPLFTQSPMRPVRNLSDEAAQANNAITRGNSTPLFARSPSKLFMPAVNDSRVNPNRASPDGQVKTLGHPRLLQVSPMKSILRSPQRLFSDDPTKLAAGTHFATPPLQRNGKNLFAGTTTLATTQKRVDFTSSTKAGEEASSHSVASGSLQGTPSSSTGVRKTARAVSSSIVEYPTLPTDSMPPSPSPQKRRQTGGPQDFTFRAGDQDIIFGPSPNAPKTNNQTRVSTIRHIPSEAATVPTPVTGSKKRKFDFENIAAAGAELNGDVSDKENTPVPAVGESETQLKKRSKPNSVARELNITTVARKPAGRVTTLGVKPKKDSGGVKKRANTITQSRLNALAQPRRRN